MLDFGKYAIKLKRSPRETIAGGCWAIRMSLLKPDIFFVCRFDFWSNTKFVGLGEREKEKSEISILLLLCVDKKGNKKLSRFGEVFICKYLHVRIAMKRKCYSLCLSYWAKW